MLVGVIMLDSQGLKPPIPAQCLANHAANELIRREFLKNQHALDKAKNEFIAISSHQLRTPATSVKNYLGILLGYDKTIPDSIRSLIQRAYDSNERQLAILDSLLQVAQIDSGLYLADLSEQNACDMVQSAIAECQEMFDLRNQHIVYSAPDSCQLIADADKFKIALHHLITNASKNTPGGGSIFITLIQTDKYTKIKVRDSGPGFAKSETKRLFKKFTHFENQISDTVNGNGLGLYIARKITKMLCGKLTVISRPNQGAEFVLAFSNRPKPNNPIIVPSK